MELKYMIPGQPATKKNSQKICRTSTGRTFVRPSDRFEQWQDMAAWYMVPKPKHPLECPLEISVLFYRKNAIRCDLTNLLEAVDDMLVYSGIIKDDNYNIIVSHDGSRVYLDRNNPRTEIYIREYGK